MSSRAKTAETCNIASALIHQAGLQADSFAIHFPVGKRGGRVSYHSATYADLNRLSDDYARGLIEYGIGRGVRCALMLPPGLDFFAVFFALFKAGAVPVLIDPGIGVKPLKACLADARPEAFIGVTRAQAARAVLGWAPGAKLVTAGPRLGWGGLSTRQLRKLGQRTSGSVLAETGADEMAALLFTSGSTGIPKGVVYRHRHFTAQVEMLRTAFAIRPGEVDLPTFPPFALFDPALGMTTVIPWMDPTRPAKADPQLLVQAIERYEVSNLFGSPALLNVLGRHTESNRIQLATMRRVISAGAAVPVATIRRLQKALPGGAEIHTPYGATECLPVASISGSGIDAVVEQRTAAGEGVCVGRPVAPNLVKIIPVSDKAIGHFSNSLELPPGISGEIVVHGPTTTDAYWQKPAQNELAKIRDAGGNTWHRMGDVGYFDPEGRLWYCGRKSQRVVNGHECLYADQVEAIFNVHPEVSRTALVGVGGYGRQTPVLCVETLQKPDAARRHRIQTDLLQMAQSHAISRSVKQILFHKSFPVDIRHNAKIGREQLAAWAARQLQ
jgi:acyl-CoA synthetase (AMP-forming)/AMP-acid ligase II